MALQSGPMLRAVRDVVVDYRPVSHDFAYAPEPKPPSPPPRRMWNGIGAFVQLTAAALLAVAIFAVMTGQLNIRWLDKKPQQAAAERPAPEAPKVVAAAPREVAPPAVAPAAPPFPMPATYGVYALSNDKLIELDKLGIRVPDARVLISPEIREPSRVTLPDGKVSFVVFRRELANGAPEKVPVRVIARIARETTFRNGKPVTMSVSNTWRIRNTSVDMKVGPVANNREMVSIVPEADSELPPGRYALVLGGIGYDFTVPGPVTASAQCLERMQTPNGDVFSECKN